MAAMPQWDSVASTKQLFLGRNYTRSERNSGVSCGSFFILPQYLQSVSCCSTEITPGQDGIMGPVGKSAPGRTRTTISGPASRCLIHWATGPVLDRSRKHVISHLATMLAIRKHVPCLLCPAAVTLKRIVHMLQLTGCPGNSNKKAYTGNTVSD